MGVKNIIYNIYHKRIEFNIISLKYMHLNPDIILESMAIKLKNRKNRILRILKGTYKIFKEYKNYI